MQSNNANTGGLTIEQLIAKHGREKGLELAIVTTALERATPDTLVKIEGLLLGGGSDNIAKAN